jgi:histidinol phosphatase-like enzyme
MDDKKGLFLDRDGTIINDCESFLYKKDIKFEKGLKEFLQRALINKLYCHGY